MPGILPMKVIKVGASSQSRIAQACDRCRSKKIRCDGIRPCCSQCANVGFECKTSDKLSRRAFPRGYTESLEERVRSLEGEVRELKDLLDEKDEKIDMLSKMHSNQRRSSHSSSGPSPMPSLKSREQSPAPKDDIFRVQASPQLLESDSSDSFFMGASSGRAFIDAFKRKVQESGKSCSGFGPATFLNAEEKSAASKTTSSSSMSSVPPRLFSDRCINIFWQEHAPLFPVLHKPTFLRLYEEYISDPEKMTNNHKLAQLHLVFSIAGFSSDLPDKEEIANCEQQWRKSLNAILMDNTLSTLQCLVLACLYCNQKGAYKSLQTYKAIAVGLSHKLGLHQSQKRFSFGALTTETRKKVFWTLYTVDCFSAASMGLPKLLSSDVETEYPAAIDDEYVEEKGFLPSLPGESSKISSAIALFRVTRLLSKILEQVYPAAASHDLSLQTLSAFETELNEWSDGLPSHLKLTFLQDKPSVSVTGDRSAILSLAYYYIKTLVHRPVVGSTLGNKASSSVISLADSSKHIIQILQLLEERSMSFSFCLNKNELLTLCGLSLLYQGIDLKQEGKLMKDGQRLISAVSKYLEKFNAPGSADFGRLATLMTPPVGVKEQARRDSDNMGQQKTARSTPSPSISVPRQLLMPVQSRYSVSEADLLQHDRNRRATFSNSPMQVPIKQSPSSRGSFDSGARPEYQNQSIAYRTPAPRQMSASIPKPRANSSSKHGQNLDYLALNTAASITESRPMKPSRTPIQDHTPTYPATNYKASVTPAEWESLLSTLDGGPSNIFDAVYGGQNMQIPDQNNMPNNHPTSLSSSAYSEWGMSPESWDMTALSMTDFEHGGAAQSVLSFSEESLSSGDDLGPADYSVVSIGSGGLEYRQGMMAAGMGDGFYVDGLDGNYGL